MLSIHCGTMPFTRELVSVDNWYATGNSAPTTTEVLLSLYVRAVGVFTFCVGLAWLAR